MKLKQYLIEASKKFILTIKELQQLDGNRMLNREAKRNIEFLIDYWYETSKKEVSYFLQMYSKAGTKALQILGNVPYYSRKDLIESLLGTEMLPEKEADIWPIPIYVSSSPNDKATIGILVHSNGKKEMFEGNDEASNETYDLVDEILGNVKPVTVFGYHGEKTVETIRSSNVLPKGLYMSPSKKYALGYWSLEENRIAFSCEAMSNAFRKESEVDWKVKEPTKIKKFRFI